MDEVTRDDAVYIMDKGQIVGHGEVSNLLAEHSMSDVADLFNHLVQHDPS